MTDEGLSADELPGIEAVAEDIQSRILAQAKEHDHLDASQLNIAQVYISGSLGGGEGRIGSDVDFVIEISYSGDASGQYNWSEYVQNDIQPSLKHNRQTIAKPLPSYIRYVDITLGDAIDCEYFLSEMTSNGGYDTVYDLTSRAYISSDRF